MVSKQRLREIFNVDHFKHRKEQYYSDIGVWGCDIPTNLSYYKLNKKNTIMRHVLKSQSSKISVCIVNLVVPVPLKELQITLDNTWYLYPVPTNAKYLGDCPAICKPHKKNAPDIWMNHKTRRTVDIFENFEDCILYCQQLNEHSLYYGVPSILSLANRLKKFHNSYEAIIDILRKNYIS